LDDRNVRNVKARIGISKVRRKRIKLTPCKKYCVFEKKGTFIKKSIIKCPKRKNTLKIKHALTTRLGRSSRPSSCVARASK
jgi:hypothetical protein